MVFNISIGFIKFHVFRKAEKVGKEVGFKLSKTTLHFDWVDLIVKFIQKIVKTALYLPVLKKSSHPDEQMDKKVVLIEFLFLERTNPKKQTSTLLQRFKV